GNFPRAPAHGSVPTWERFWAFSRPHRSHVGTFVVCWERRLSHRQGHDRVFGLSAAMDGFWRVGLGRGGSGFFRRGDGSLRAGPRLLLRGLPWLALPAGGVWGIVSGR